MKCKYCGFETEDGIEYTLHFLNEHPEHVIGIDKLETSVSKR